MGWGFSLGTITRALTKARTQAVRQTVKVFKIPVALVSSVFIKKRGGGSYPQRKNKTFKSADQVGRKYVVDFLKSSGDFFKNKTLSDLYGILANYSKYMYIDEEQAVRDEVSYREQQAQAKAAQAKAAQAKAAQAKAAQQRAAQAKAAQQRAAQAKAAQQRAAQQRASKAFKQRAAKRAAAAKAAQAKARGRLAQAIAADKNASFTVKAVQQRAAQAQQAIKHTTPQTTAPTLQPKKSNMTAILAGAGAGVGMVAGGPVGAIIGAGIGAMTSGKKG